MGGALPCAPPLRPPARPRVRAAPSRAAMLPSSAPPPRRAAGAGAGLGTTGAARLHAITAHLFPPGAARGAATAAATTASAIPAPAPASAGGPAHLFFLVHGLAGQPEDLSCLRDNLAALSGGRAAVHLARANVGRGASTHDGIDGARAQRAAAQRHPRTPP